MSVAHYRALLTDTFLIISFPSFASPELLHSNVLTVHLLSSFVPIGITLIPRMFGVVFL